MVLSGKYVKFQYRQPSICPSADKKIACRKVSTSRAKQLADQLGYPYFETSAFTGLNVDKSMECLLDTVMQRIQRMSEDQLTKYNSDVVEIGAPGDYDSPVALLFGRFLKAPELNSSAKLAVCRRNFKTSLTKYFFWFPKENFVDEISPTKCSVR
uniref:Uncharacterized protein n=1 Tax=Romanomermis culicivorax TaxID=13658 RepID=A0A915I1D2_ROMCU